MVPHRPLTKNKDLRIPKSKIGISKYEEYNLIWRKWTQNEVKK